MIFEPKSDFQRRCLTASEDIILIGGAAGASKTTILFFDSIRNSRKPLNMVFFRRHAKDVMQPGGLWDEATKWYSRLPCRSNQLKRRFTFASGATITFMHADRLDLVKDDFRGAQIDVLYFDEVTELDEEVFWFLQSRNRPSNSHGSKPYTMMTCNPEDNWVKRLVDPYLDDYGYPITERCNTTGYVRKYGDECTSFITKEDVVLSGYKEAECFSFKFLPGTLKDNPVLLERDPNYFRRLATVPEYYRKAMVEGCWKFPAKVKMFDRRFFTIIDRRDFPRQFDLTICTTDLAIRKGQFSDYTVFSVWGSAGGVAYLLGMYRGKWGFEEQKTMLLSLLESFDDISSIYVENAIHGSAFVESFKKTSSQFSNVYVKLVNRTSSKYERACESLPFLENHGIVLAEGPESTLFLQEVLNYNGEESSSLKKDDICDTMFDACRILGKHIARKKYLESENKFALNVVTPLMKG